MDLAIDTIREAWGGPVTAATSRGRAMFSGMIREIREGAKLHFDEITREFPGILDHTPASFLSINWYLSMPEKGGETSVYRHPWHPRDERFRDGYGYLEDVVAGDPVATVRPETGDALIFDTRNLHLVRPVAGQGRRVSLSFFLGITGSGALQLWS
ncbi:2OG-Fe(II) oxygenase, partial [Actinomadura adrarensis]